MHVGPSLRSSTRLLKWLENAQDKELSDEDWFQFYELLERVLNDYLAVIKILHQIDVFKNQKMLKIVFSTPLLLESKANTSVELTQYLTLDHIGTLNLCVRFERLKYK